MTTVSFIGAGNIGGTVAKLAVAAGHDVLVSNSRGPETLGDVVAGLGERATAVTAAEAAAGADLVVLSIPLKAVPELPDDVRAALAGRVVIDTSNYYPEQRDGRIAALDEKRTTTTGLVAEHLPGARVVKAFNNIFWGHLRDLARPGTDAGSPERSALAIAGDDESAKAAATEFIASIGYDVLDTGTLADSGRFEPGTPAYGLPYAVHPEAFAGGEGDLTLSQRVSVETLREAVEAGRA